MSLILVDHILEVNLVQVIRPWMQHLETLILHVLDPVPLDICPHKLKSCLEREYRICQVVLLDLLLWVLKEVGDCLDAGLALQVLALDQFLEEFLQFSSILVLP